MDVLKLRYLIREAIEDTIKQQTVFSMGDKVTTVDGDTATITMVEHPFYTVELESTGTTKSFQFKDLAPFVEKEIEPQNEGFLLKENVNVSPGLEFHYKNKLNLLECVYRIGSEAYINFYAEAKKLLKEGKIEVNALDKEVLKTDIGEYGIFEGKKVPLDLPMLNEYFKYDNVASYDYKNYKDKHFDICPAAEGLRDRLLAGEFKDQVRDKNLATQKEIGEWLYRHDILFQVEKQVLQDKEGDESDIEEAKHAIDRIVNLSRDLGIPVAEISYLNAHLKKIKDIVEYSSLTEAKKKKKDPPLGKPKRGGSKAYYVYVRDPKTKRIKKVSFGSGGLRAKINNPKARQAFAKRHRCKEKNDRTKPSYWSCRLPRYAKALGLGANKNTFW